MLLQAALKRLQLDYVDLIFCHRPDVFTPIEETVRAMNFVIEQGWAFYWGTSEWSAQQITEVRHSPNVLDVFTFFYQCNMSNLVICNSQHVQHCCNAATLNVPQTETSPPLVVGHLYWLLVNYSVFDGGYLRYNPGHCSPPPALPYSCCDLF